MILDLFASGILLLIGALFGALAALVGGLKMAVRIISEQEARARVARRRAAAKRKEVKR